MDVNRIWIISDTHFGVRSNSLEWLEIQKDYYNKWLIPLLKEKVQPGDIMFHLGDLFDNRQSINILVLNTVIEIFEKISQILPLHILLGNHDTYRKTSNDINSIKIFEYMNNITVYQEPTEIILSKDNLNKKILLMPWRQGPEEEITTIKEHPNCDYLFCHTDIHGLRYNRIRMVESGNDISVYEYFKRVLSGHIHYRQTYHNITMVGCPYPLTRSDINNEKGIYLFDPFKNKLQFFENKFSPKFIRINIEDLMELSLDKFLKLIKNNFVDIIVNIRWSIDFPFTALMDIISGFRKISIISVIDDDEDKIIYDDNSTSDLSNFNIMKLAEKYIETLNYSAKVKDATLKKINELYSRIISGGSIEYNN